MKFFTRRWIHGGMTDEDAQTVVPAYLRYVESLGLPPSVKDLAILNPHDAYILEVEHESRSRTLCLRLRCGDVQRGYFDALIRLSNVTILAEHVAMLTDARRPAPVEILYDEVDRADAGAFQYRLLLHPAGEVAIAFTDIAITRHPVTNRYAV